MNNRQAQILSELYRSHQQHTSESLAHLFGVSERTIRKLTSFQLLTLNFNAKSYDLVIDVPETWTLEVDIVSSNAPIVI